MDFIKDKKAQGAIEYLLIIAGAILIAAVVISIITYTTKEGKEDVTNMVDDEYQDVIDDGKDLIVDNE